MRWLRFECVHSLHSHLGMEFSTIPLSLEGEGRMHLVLAPWLHCTSSTLIQLKVNKRDVCVLFIDSRGEICQNDYICKFYGIKRLKREYCWWFHVLPFMLSLFVMTESTLVFNFKTYEILTKLYPLVKKSLHIVALHVLRYASRTRRWWGYGVCACDCRDLAWLRILTGFSLLWFLLSQLFFSYFKELIGKEVTVELKNDLAISGTMHSVDQYLNIKLHNCKVVDDVNYPHMVRNAMGTSSNIPTSV